MRLMTEKEYQIHKELWISVGRAQAACERAKESVVRLRRITGLDSDDVLGYCIHGVDLDREFCPKGCRV